MVLRDEQWARIGPLLPGKVGDPGRSAADNRPDNRPDNRGFVEGILWIARVGAPWRDLPEKYGNSVFKRFRRRANNGIFDRVFETGFLRSYRRMPISNTGSSMERLSGCISTVPAPGGIQNQTIGRSRGVTTKIVALVNALGNLVRFVLLPGQRHDSVGVAPFSTIAISPLCGPIKPWTPMRSGPIWTTAAAVIPPKANRVIPIACDLEMYKWRQLGKLLLQTQAVPPYRHAVRQNR